MSLYPMWPSMRDMVGDIQGQMSLFDQNFGLGLLNDDLISPRGVLAGPHRTGYIRPWRHMPGRQSGMSNLSLDNDGFKVNLDVQQFKPEEVNVKVVDNCVTVEGNHEERLDEHGFVTRQFKRRYILPKEIEHEAIVSTLSSDGVLTIQAPKKKPIALADQNERVVPILHTQAPAVKHSKTVAIANGAGQKMES